MQKIFDEVNSLDKRCYEELGLSEDILMEHAAIGMQNFIEDKFENNSKILIVCGSGNNGADGITLARLLFHKYDIDIVIPFGVKSTMGKIQLSRIKKLGLDESTVISENSYDVVVDCLFGSGLNKELKSDAQELLKQMNSLKAFKLACDIPSGIDKDGKILTVVFHADTTITMGALKKSLYSDSSKDYVGNIIVSDLGVQRVVYEDKKTNCYLLEENDLKLPIRNSQNTHKGTFGHLAVVVGCKTGAGVLTSLAGYNMGAGLVSVIDHENLELPYHIMQSHQIPKNTTALAIGMGLGNFDKNEIKSILSLNIPKLIDADLFYTNDILHCLEMDDIVLTPHPKEFCSLLKICDLADIDVKVLQMDRFKYLQMFCTKYPKVVLLLKGANVLIGQNEKLYLNPLGSNRLSFGGSGDVLAGFISGLLAQGYCSLEATIQGSLIHTLTAQSFSGNDFSMTPQDLIEGVKTL